MSECCRKCLKIFCRNRGTKENCSECYSEVLKELKEINKKIKE